MGIVQDFKTFAVKGNVIDLAVGVIIGAALQRLWTRWGVILLCRSLARC